MTDGRAENKITMGTVDLTLTETVNGVVVGESTSQLDGILPSQTVDQVAEIKNTGNQDYWLRVRADVKRYRSPAGRRSGQPRNLLQLGQGEVGRKGRLVLLPSAVPAGETVTL